MRHRARFLALAVGLTFPALADAATFVVTTYDDGVTADCAAVCSLRTAVIEANADPDDDLIQLSAGTYLLDRDGDSEDQAFTGDLDILAGVTIRGPGAGMTTIDGGGLEHVFSVIPPEASVVVFEGLKITGAAAGAAGIRTRFSADVTVDRCELTGNPTGGATGALNAELSSTLTVRSSSIYANTGHGVNVVQASATLENTTLSGNDQVELVAGSGSDVHCFACTISDPADSSDEVVATGSGTLIEFTNSIVAGACFEQLFNSIHSLSGNVESPGNTCHFTGASVDQNTVSAVNLALGALADNGGPTPSHLLDAASVVLDDAVDATQLAGDQRGATRPVTNRDPGSTEREAVRPPTPIFADGFGQGDPEAWSSTVP